ncbi:MAG: transporter substrate-binding domain-containing protein [Pseudomonadota bacterium]
MSWKKYALVRVLAAGALSLSVLCAGASADGLPKIIDPGLLTTKPSLDGLLRFRFVTTLDFPPFNFADENKKPTGFNVDLARAICVELAIEARCEIQAVPWEELNGALGGRRAEAIIAGYEPTAEFRTQYRLSEPYFRFPARIVARVDNLADKEAALASTVSGKSRIGVIDGSSHAAFLENFFPEKQLTKFPDTSPLYNALQGGEVDAIFTDGVSASFWLVSDAANGCCDFSGAPVFHPDYFGRGMVIAVRAGDATLQNALNFALKELEAKGTTEEIFVRYFPKSPF